MSRGTPEFVALGIEVEVNEKGSSTSLTNNAVARITGDASEYVQVLEVQGRQERKP